MRYETFIYLYKITSQNHLLVSYKRADCQTLICLSLSIFFFHPGITCYSTQGCGPNAIKDCLISSIGCMVRRSEISCMKCTSRAGCIYSTRDRQVLRHSVCKRSKFGQKQTRCGVAQKGLATLTQHSPHEMRPCGSVICAPKLSLPARDSITCYRSAIRLNFLIKSPIRNQYSNRLPLNI